MATDRRLYLIRLRDEPGVAPLYLSKINDAGTRTRARLFNTAAGADNYRRVVAARLFPGRPTRVVDMYGNPA